MIPKIVHYCWFGGKSKPKLARRCIKSWKKYLPDYTFKEWNERNFDINSNLYVKQAYEARRYAFVTDYVRLYALYHEGGIYMDTDVEVLSSFDPFLQHTAFSGYESNSDVTTGIMASEKNGKWVGDQLKHYDTLSFLKDDGSMDLTTNVLVITEYMKPLGLRQDNTFQDFPGLITLYPSDYFCPKSWKTGEINLTERSVTIHHFAGSWLPQNNLSKKEKFIKFSHNIFHGVLQSCHLEDWYNRLRRK